MMNKTNSTQVYIEDYTDIEIKHMFSENGSNILRLSDKVLEKAEDTLSPKIVYYNGIEEFFIISTNCPDKTLALIARTINEAEDYVNAPTDTLFDLLCGYGYEAKHTGICTSETSAIEI